MDISPQSFVSVNIILADVLALVDDSSFKLRSEGWYKSQIQQSLEELSFDTFFNRINKSFEIPKKLRLELPKGAFNLRQVYLFNGDDCNIQSKVNVWHKNHFINSKSGKGYVARDSWGNQDDLFHIQRTHGREDKIRGGEPNGLYYYSMQNGEVMLSESCLARERIMLVYNGLITDIGEEPIIPQFFRQYVKDWISVKALEAKSTTKVATNEYSHWIGLLRKYEMELKDPYEGSAIKAERRVKVLNDKQRQDLKEYWSKLNH